MRAGQSPYVFPQELAERVLRFCDAAEHKDVCARLSDLIGHDAAAWRSAAVDTEAPGPNGLVSPKTGALRAQNPSLLRDNSVPAPGAGAAASPELRAAREALYAATRVMMRAAPTDALTEALFEAACEAWLAEVTQEPELATYAASREVLKDTRTIWAYKQSLGRVNLMGRAQLPPFFDGNTQLVELFLQSPHAQCDLKALAELPNLRCLSLYVDPHSPLVADIRRLVPKLERMTPEAGVIVHLTVPGYALPKD